MAAKKPTVAKRATTSEVADLQRIDAFLRVMDAGSFTVAARTSGVPKSSLSRAVSKLERQLGVLLIQRTTRKLVITEAGQHYLTHARAALSMLAEAQSSLRDADSEPRGLVRVTMLPDPTGDNFCEALMSFTRRYPGIQLEVLFTPQRLDLVTEGVDLAVRAGSLDDSPGLVGRRIGCTPGVLVASPAYLKERGTPRKLEQLAEHECLLFRGARGSQRWSLIGKRGPETVQVHGRLSVDEVSYLRHLALGGASIALVPKVLATDAIESGTLVHVLPQYRQEGAGVYLLHPAMPHLPRRVALLRDHLVVALKDKFVDG